MISHVQPQMETDGHRLIGGKDGAVNDLLNGQLRPKQAICQSKNAG
jgi:hypothetical protein